MRSSSSLLAVVALVSAPLLACSSSSSSPGVTTTDSGDASLPPLLSDAGTCGVTTQRYSISSASHVPQGTVVPYVSNPPCGGDHYGSWVTWGAHAIAIPAGNWVHNLEHGGVVFLYRCASRAACPDLAAKLEGLAAKLPVDPLCTAEGSGIRTRILVIPDPDLPVGVEVAAAAWNNTLIARCFDEAALHAFFVQHEGHASEQTCAQGFIEDGSLLDAGPSDGGDASIDDAPSDGGKPEKDAPGK
jgi:hypothetical protein